MGNKTPQTLLEAFKISIAAKIKQDIQTSPKTMKQIGEEYGISVTIVERFGRELFLETGFRRKPGRPKSKVAV
jgi:hypothetical protein